MARHVIIMLGSKTFSLDRGWHYLSTHNKSVAESPMSDFFELNTTRASIFGSPLICLLLKFYNRRCSVARDRIFSLVSLCSEKGDIKIDYECPAFQLAHQVVTACHSTICICTTILVLEMLESDIRQLSSDALALLMTDGPYLEFELAPLELEHYSNDYIHHNYIDHGSCALLGKLIRDSTLACPVKCDGEDKNFPRGFSCCENANRFGKQKLRVSFAYAWAWYKQQDSSKLVDIEQRLGVRAESVGKYTKPTNRVPRLGWGNSDMYQNQS